MGVKEKRHPAPLFLIIMPVRAMPVKLSTDAIALLIVIFSHALFAALFYILTP
jgi:hypothetical protein